MSAEKVELLLEGLCCAGCAAKIEAKVNELNGVDNAALNLVNRVLYIEAEAETDMAALIKVVEGIVKKLEPEVVVKNRLQETHQEAHNESCHNHGDEGHHHENDHQHDEGHDHGHTDYSNKGELIKLGIGAALFFAAIILKLDDKIEFGMYFISYLLIGGEVLLRAGKNILRGQVFDENFLMAIATIGAFAIGEFPEGAAVMLFHKRLLAPLFACFSHIL